MAFPIFGSAQSVSRQAWDRCGDGLPSPNFMLTVAAAPFRMPNALTMGGGMRSWGWFILKFSSDRSVCAPQYLSAGTWISPNASLSVRVEAMLRVDENWRRCALFCKCNWGRGKVERALLCRLAPRLQVQDGVTTEGLTLACASERNAPASADRAFVKADRNMALVWQLAMQEKRKDGN